MKTARQSFFAAGVRTLSSSLSPRACRAKLQAKDWRRRIGSLPRRSEVATPLATCRGFCYSVSAESQEERERERRAEDYYRLTGRLQSLPQVAPHKEHLSSALRRTQRVQTPKTIKSKHKREISSCAIKLDALTKELAVPLGKYVKGFPSVSRLHPFEAALLHLTVDANKYTALLERVNTVRKKLLDAGKANASRASKCKSPREAALVLDEGTRMLENIYRKEENTMDKLLYVTQQLRRLPFVDPQLCTFVLAGAPNVGKSSLVVSLSSGQPEICNYPFTTRSIKMGHFDWDGERFQVTDTPGLLSRSDEERNEMEGLTLAALEHLDNVVVFVMDLTGECGTRVRDQLDIRREIRTRFPEKKHKWIDVFAKADMFSIKEGEEGEEGEGEEGATTGGGGSHGGGLVIEKKANAEDKYHLDHEFLDEGYLAALEEVPGALWISTKTGESHFASLTIESNRIESNHFTNDTSLQCLLVLPQALMLVT